MRLFVYDVSPIDVWAGWATEEEFIKQIQDEVVSTDMSGEIATIKGITAKAEMLAKRKGWEGDHSMGPFYSGIPNKGGDSHCGFLIGWKQYNNGTTFIASPYRLPWLDEDTDPAVG